MPYYPNQLCHMIRTYISLIIIFVYAGPVFAQWQTFDVFENGTYQDRITILLLSEGYTESELVQFRVDVEKVTEDIFSESPFREYKDFFRVVAVEVASNESGASSFFDGDERDTYFRSTFGQNGGRNISLMFPVGTGRLYDIRTALDLGWWNSITMVLVNDDRIGGGPEIVTRGMQNFEIVVHEIGHQFGRLADEYEETGRTPIPGPNVTNITARDHIPWRHWILPETPIPTPVETAYFDNVGLFEGAAYQSQGWFRPQLGCRMRYNTDHFCAVCHEQLIGRMYTEFNSGRILTVFPAQGFIRMYPAQLETFRYTGALPEHGLRYEWRVNDMVVSNDIEFEFNSDLYGQGDHVLELRITDDNPNVRDPEIMRRMTTVRNWDISVAESTSLTPIDHQTSAVSLGPVYPNPVRNQTMISFRLPEHQHVEIAVYDLTGRKIAMLSEGVLPQGEHRIPWTSGNLSAGMYLISLQTAQVKLSRTIMIVR